MDHLDKMTTKPALAQLMAWARGPQIPSSKGSDPDQTLAEPSPGERVILGEDALPLPASFEDPATKGDTGRPLTSALLHAGPYRAIVCSWGARLVHFSGADRVDVIIGPKDWPGILGDDSAMGAVMGRVAGRISLGRLPMPSGAVHQLPLNDGRHHLHGGPKGFDRRFWHLAPLPPDPAHPGEARIKMTLSSADGDQGYPGQLDVEVLYALSPQGQLSVTLSTLVTGHTSPVNLTHHAYWNLAGGASVSAAKGQDPDCLSHIFHTPLKAYLATTPECLPTGQVLPCAGTPFDFSTPKPLGFDWPTPDGDPPTHLPVPGFDTFFVASDKVHPSGDCREIAALEDTASGRILRVRSDQPGFQLYTGNYLGAPYVQNEGVAIEPSLFLDAVNHPQFPPIMVQPGQTLRQRIIFVLEEKTDEEAARLRGTTHN